ncbi:MAG: c-type cytochrome domain-containing protein [Bacteroidota bacterium]
MRAPRLHSTIVLAGIIGILSGCSDMGTEPEPAPSPTLPPGQVSFSQNVLPIFSSAGCTGCHGGNGGLNVGTVQQLMQGGNHGPAVVAGNANSSVIIQKLSPNPPFGNRMPQGGPYLSDNTVAVIRAWIDQGALDN